MEHLPSMWHIAFKNQFYLFNRGHRAISLFGQWTLTMEIIGLTKKSNVNLYILSNCIASSLIYKPLILMWLVTENLDQSRNLTYLTRVIEQ